MCSLAAARRGSRFARSRGELPGGGKSRSAIACKVTAVREGCRAYLIAECRARFKLVDLRSVRSEFAASEKGHVKDGEGLLEAMVTGQIGSLHFVAIAATTESSPNQAHLTAPYPTRSE